MEKINKIFAVLFCVCGVIEVIVTLYTQDKFFLILGAILIVLALLIWRFRYEEKE